METGTIIWWSLTRRKAKPATFAGQRVSAESVETVATARTREAKTLKFFIARAPQPCRLRSLWARASIWSRWIPDQFLNAADQFLNQDDALTMELRWRANRLFSAS